MHHSNSSESDGRHDINNFGYKIAIVEVQNTMILFIVPNAQLALDKAHEYFKLSKSKEFFWPRLNVDIVPTTLQTNPNLITPLSNSTKTLIE